MILWWIKQDFRLSDNTALTNALKHDEAVLALFIVEPSTVSAAETSTRHLNAQLSAFAALRTLIRRHGGDCCLLTGEVIPVLEKVHSMSGFERLVSHEEVGVLRTYRRDLAVATWCREKGVLWEEFAQTGVFRGLDDRDTRSARWKGWMGNGPLTAPAPFQLERLVVPEKVMALWPSDRRRHTAWDRIDQSCAPDIGRPQRVSEPLAHAVLDDFLDRRAIGYSGGISSPNTAFRSGSRLSVHLAWGTITGREVYAAVNERIASVADRNDDTSKLYRKSLRAFLGRLHWRDHFAQRLESEPDMEAHSLNRAYDELPVSDEQEKHLQAWVTGRTGFPLVDACVRCATTTGFLNFRMRCLITSLACHCLQIDWRAIQWPMAQWWTDFVPGIHISQLQMQAGVVGINTLRIYSPAKQIVDQDPEARFIKRWVPELRDTSAADIIAHQDTPSNDYAEPLVNWRESTAGMRASYYAIRRSDHAKACAEVVLKAHGSRRPARARRKPKVA